MKLKGTSRKDRFASTEIIFGINELLKKFVVDETKLREFLAKLEKVNTYDELNDLWDAFANTKSGPIRTVRTNEVMDS